MARASPALASFNAGELSPKIAGRSDTEKYQAGCKIVENFIPLIQGPATRRGGIKYVTATKDSDDRSWLVRFEFSTEQAYLLEFGDQYVRFYFDHGQVIVSGVAAYNGATAYEIGDLASSAGVNYYAIAATTGNAPPNATYWYPLTGSIYEIPSPYTAADLTNSDGTFGLRIVQSADVLYICNGNYQTRKLTRYGATEWVFDLLEPTWGPFKTQNITTTTVVSSAQTGAVTLTASTSIFLPGHVGSLFYLEARNVSSIVSWEAGKSITSGTRVRSDGKTYLAANTATTGGDRPVHTVGTRSDGTDGVSWEFLEPGYGYVRITSYASGTSVGADVIERLPIDTVGDLATTRWAFSAWSVVEGWPTHAAFFRERLVFGKNIDINLSVAGDFENFNPKDGSGVIVTDGAFKRTLVSSQVNEILWMDVFSPTSESLMIGTAGSEFAIRSQTESQPFGSDNCSAQPVSSLGSRNVSPVRVNNTILFVQRSGQKLRDLTYDYYTGNQGSNDQTLYADHIPTPGLCQMAYQPEPFSVIWCARTDGKLVAMTYNKEQYANPPHGGWHRHPITNGFVESICAIPTDTGNELWLIIRRTIDGVTKRYVEYMTQDFALGGDQQDAFFVDCGNTLDNSINATLTLGAGADTAGTTGVVFTAGSSVFVAGDVGRQIQMRYSIQSLDESGNEYTQHLTAKATITAYTSGTIVEATIDAAFPSLDPIAVLGWRMTVTEVSGLSYLEGQTVDVLIDGATHPQRTVSGGMISLQSPASKIQIGLPMPARLQTMRLNAGAQDGTSQGKKTRIPTAVVRLLETLGLRQGSSFTELDEVDFRAPSALMDNAVPLFTGDIDLDFPDGYNTNPWLCFEQKDPLPCTIVGIYPQSVVSDKG